jgi:hypothetical protein
MKHYEGYAEAKAITGEFDSMVPGGYICKIKAVTCEDKPYGELLTIEFDIAEGEKKGFYQKQFDETKKWYGKYYQTIKKDDLRFFKGFITAIEESNSGFKWNWDEKALVGKLFGAIFAEEEYQNDKGEVKVSCKCRQVRSVQAIKEGKFKVPELKKLSNSTFTSTSSPTFNPFETSDEELPWK